MFAELGFSRCLLDYRTDSGVLMHCFSWAIGIYVDPSAVFAELDVCLFLSVSGICGSASRACRVMKFQFSSRFQRISDSAVF